LILVDPSTSSSSLAAATVALLREAGARVITVMVGENIPDAALGSMIMSPIDFDDFARLFEQLASLQIECDEIVPLAGLSPFGEPSTVACETRCISALLLVQALNQAQMTGKPRLTLVTAKGVAPCQASDA